MMEENQHLDSEHTVPDLKERIISFYYQRISSPEASKFRSNEFTGQFKGLTLGDFSRYNILDNQLSEGPVAKIVDHSLNSPEDFRATLRGIKKDLILLDYFLHGQEKREGK